MQNVSHGNDQLRAPARDAKAPARWASSRPPPEPLSVPVFDSHTHLDLTVQEARSARCGGRRIRSSALLDAAAKAGVDRLVQVGVDVASSRWGADLAARQPARARRGRAAPERGAAGWPTWTRRCARLRRSPRLPQVRGIGETGLDHYRTESGFQEETFRRHIDIAKRYGKTLVIHDRDAHAEVLRVLAPRVHPPGGPSLLLGGRRLSPPSVCGGAISSASRAR